MRLIMCEQPDLDNPEVRISYREITEGVKRVADFVRSVDQTVCCKNNSGEYAIPSSDIYYIESVDKKTFVRVSKSTVLNVEKLTGVKTIVNSKLEAMLSNGERVCVTRKYLKEIKTALQRRNGR